MTQSFMQWGGAASASSGIMNCRFRNDQAEDAARMGAELVAKHQFAAARQRYEMALRLDPNNGAYHLELGFCLWHLGEDQATGHHLQEAIKHDPSLAKAHSTLAMWYLIHGLSDAAESESARACELAPHDLEVLTTRGNVLEHAGESEAVCQILRRAERTDNPTPAFAMLNGRMARRRGNVPEALRVAFNVLNSGRCTELEASALHLMASTLLDGMGQFDRAFEHAQRGNAIRRPAWNPQQATDLVDRNIRYFTREKCQSLPRSTQTSPVPVFIVGFVRSGTSLVEQILASHPDIFGGGEMDLLHHTEAETLRMLKASPSAYPACLEKLTPDQADGLAQSHLLPLQSLKPGAQRIIDKMPFNALHFGLLQQILPGSRIIWCRRDAMDTCLSAFMTQFSHGNEFKYDQTHLGKFYRDYERLLNHWKQVLTLPILEVCYEKLVSDVEAESRRMLEFLDMRWNDRCARFYETKRPVATASSEQVRNRPYASSVGRAQHYLNHLAPLKSALGL